MRALGMMFSTGMKEITGGWHWWVKLRGKVLEEGVEREKKRAAKALEAAAGKAVVSVQAKSRDRHNLYLSFKSRAKRRPYLAAWVVKAVMGGLDEEFICNEAASEEQSLFEAVMKSAMPPLHPAALDAPTAAARMLKDMKALGWLEEPKKAERWARGFLGDAFVMYLEDGQEE